MLPQSRAERTSISDPEVVWSSSSLRAASQDLNQEQSPHVQPMAESGAGWAERPATDGAAEETQTEVAEADAEVTGVRGTEEVTEEVAADAS